MYRCVCDSGFEGTACAEQPTVEIVQTVVNATEPVEEQAAEEEVAVVAEEPPEPEPCGGNNCSDQGVCNGSGKCDCFSGYEGADCSIATP